VETNLIVDRSSGPDYELNLTNTHLNAQLRGNKATEVEKSWRMLEQIFSDRHAGKIPKEGIGANKN
jgi:hypothetical protein